jgi:hypothetical protein
MNIPPKKFSHNYTPEKLAEFTYNGLIDMKEKAFKAGASDLVSMCDFEISRRPPLPSKLKFVSMASSSRSGRSPSVTEVDHQTSALLVEALEELTSKYDLSKETAKKISKGFPRFIAHNLLSSDGTAKVGGAKLLGRVAINNFISYRFKGDVFALCISLENNKHVSQVKYLVLAPKSYLQNYQPIHNLLPLEGEDDLGLIDGGEQFESFQEALNVYSNLIDQVAPKKL